MELSREGNVAAFVVLWVTGLLKVAGGLLALALARPRDSSRVPRPALLAAGWAAAALLTLYGGVQIAIQLLVRVGAIAAPADMDRRGFDGHLYLWNPWFLLWGVLLTVTAFSYTRATGGLRGPHWPGGIGRLRSRPARGRSSSGRVG